MGRPTPLWRSWGSSSPRKRRSLAGRTEQSDPRRNPWRSRRRAPAPTSNSDLRTKTKPQFSINHASLMRTPFLVHEQQRAPDLHNYRSRDRDICFLHVSPAHIFLDMKIFDKKGCRMLFFIFFHPDSIHSIFKVFTSNLGISSGSLIDDDSIHTGLKCTLQSLCLIFWNRVNFFRQRGQRGIKRRWWILSASSSSM